MSKNKKDDEGDALFDDDINGEMAEVKVEPPESPAAVASSSSLTARYVNLEMSPSFSIIAKNVLFVHSTFIYFDLFHNQSEGANGEEQDEGAESEEGAADGEGDGGEAAARRQGGTQVRPAGDANSSLSRTN